VERGSGVESPNSFLPQARHSRDTLDVDGPDATDTMLMGFGLGLPSKCNPLSQPSAKEGWQIEYGKAY
jgi:hypothetical protein